MFFNYDISFSLVEWLTLSGLLQTIVILVYIVFRVRDWRQTLIPIAYFLFLALAFGLQFALRLDELTQPIRLSLWFARAMGWPLCYLLVNQVATLKPVSWRRFWLLICLPVPLAAAGATVIARFAHVCDADRFCDRFFDLLYWCGAMVGALCILFIWAHKNIFNNMWNVKGSRERYWLVITLIAANILRILVSLLFATSRLGWDDADALQVALGIAFAYLATTTLFRVYPLPVQLNATSRATALMLSEEERAIAEKVRNLMEIDKVYQEPTFSRADLAKEVGTSENVLSKVINRAFGKSFPRLLNEFRVEDAKRMLQDPGIPIQVLAFEVGFNSLASFNRVFREVTGDTPSHYRAAHIVSQETAAS